MVKTKGITIPVKADKKQLDKDLDDVDKKFDKLAKGAKGLALGLTAVFALIGVNALNHYLQDNKQFTKDMEASWIALGSIFSGVIDAIVNGIRKLVTGILYLMQCITGTNYIAKANEMILKKQAKETKNLTNANKKLTASFDELNVMQDTANKSGTDDDTAYRLLDLNELSSGAISTIEKIARVLKPVYDMVKGIIDWALKHPEAIVGILGGAVLLSFLGKVLGVAGVGGAVGTGLAGILGVLLAIASIGVITICIKYIKEEVDKLEEEDKNNVETTNQLTKDTKKLNNEMKTSIKTKDLDEKETEKLTNQIKLNSQSTYESAKALQEENKAGGWLTQTVNSLTGHTKANKQQIDKSIETIKSNIEVLKAEGETYGWTEDRMNAYRDQLRMLVDLTDDSVETGEKLGITYEDVNGNLGKVTQTLEGTNEGWLNNIKWNQEAREEIGRVNRKLQDGDTWLDRIRNKIAEVNGKTISVDVEFHTNSNKLSDRLFYVASQTNSSSFMSLARVLSRVGLATGGIVNLPGKGVPLGNVVTGEVNAEGIVPLTDEQAMETMGRAIGRHVTIPVTVINQMNGRTISRELQIVQADSDFAYNK